MADNMVQVLEGLGSGGGCVGCRGGVGGLGAPAPEIAWAPGLVFAGVAIGAAWWLSRAGNTRRSNLGGRGRRRGSLGGFKAGPHASGSILPTR